MKVKHLLPVLALCFSLFVNAQNVAKNANLQLKDGPIKEQFEFILKNSNKYQNYKVVKRVWIEKLQRNVADSINAVQKDLSTEIAKVATQQTEIEKLKSDLATVNQKIEDLNTEKDSMSLLGLQFSKGNYQSLMWGIIGVLAILWLFFTYRFRASNAITKEAKAKLAETEQEFEEHRKRALEREQQVRRKLQDEINKNKN
ncbi:tRNA (guanine-N1)-methyltransferase [Kordia sp.]|uniref:tRNA (guanine-N1)-methyltransferase n=1 Tax=Kordia sp. TaxID=1965332 RepID=UPI0025BBA832|nr:tRNA (guanine-N1)-methyltransferase [Kordia sp.]MCH2196085.1 tRNA (guanine-N1)-methyltransferase [Kordia sp.]